MIGNKFVFNAVAHAYNMSDANVPNSHYADRLRDGLVHLHMRQGGFAMNAAGQCTDWPIEVLAKTLFLESDCDMAATHTLRLDSWFHDGLCRREKTVEAVRRWPQRFVGYVGVDPTLGLETCLDDLDEQLDEMPEAVGLKLYPSQVNPHRAWRMDDESLAFPLFERARKRGVRTIAVHKAAPFGPVPIAPFKVDDIDLAADAFPDLAFEIIHAGLAFTEETALLLALFPNVYANFEVTSALINSNPLQFETVLGTFMRQGGSEKIIYSDGTMVLHSQPIIEKFQNYRFSEEALKKFNIPQLTDQDIANILGLNYAKIIGVDVEKAKAAIADDEFSRERARTGIQPPFSNWRTHLEQTAREIA